MTAIHIPHKHLKQQHQGRVVIDAANHAGANALAAMTFHGAVFDVVANRPVSYSMGAPVYGAGPTGYGLRATGGYKLRLLDNPVYLQKQEVTYYAVLQSTGGGNVGNVFSRNMGSSTASVAIGVHRGSFNGWGVAVNGTTSDLIAYPLVNIGAAAVSVPATLVLTVGGGVASLYVNGQFAGSGNYGGDIDYSRTDQGLDVFATSVGVSAFSGLLYGAGVIDGVMDPEAAKDFSENPWQLFRADPIRIYSLPTGPIIPSISAVTMSNILQTSATTNIQLVF